MARTAASRTAKAKLDEAAQAAPSEGDAVAAAPQQTPDGILIVVQYGENGTLTDINVQVLGTTRVSEADTLLKKAQAVVHESLGIS